MESLRRHEREIDVDPINLGAIRFGIYLLPPGSRRRRLERWITDRIERIHCLAWTAETGLRSARLLADLRAAGESIPIKDSSIAAIALAHGLTVAIRNTRDFAKVGAEVIDPSH